MHTLKMTTTKSITYSSHSITVVRDTHIAVYTDLVDDALTSAYIPPEIKLLEIYIQRSDEEDNTHTRRLIDTHFTTFCHRLPQTHIEHLIIDVEIMTNPMFAILAWAIGRTQTLKHVHIGVPCEPGGRASLYIHPLCQVIREQHLRLQDVEVTQSLSHTPIPTYVSQIQEAFQ